MPSREDRLDVGSIEVEMRDPETWRAFYLLQFDRIAQHETSRLSASNFIVASSVVGLSLVVKDASDRSLTGVVLLGFAIINLFALAWNYRSRQWVTLSRNKADVILRHLDPNA